MKIDNAINQVTSLKKSVSEISKILNNLKKLSTDPDGNLKAIQANLTKLNGFLEQLELDNNVNQMRSWAADLGQDIERRLRTRTTQLGNELSQELANRNMQLTGQFPELKTRWYVVELDEGKDKAALWFGPKEDKIAECPMSAHAIAKTIEDAEKNLGSPLDVDKLIDKLRQAYKRVRAVHSDQKVPICDILADMSILVQKPGFRTDPQKKSFQDYRRHDLAYDLYRLKEYCRREDRGLPFRLETAARAYARRRGDFLWVPNSESGEGQRYSHFVIREDRG